jgi:hypothetical protein
LFKQADSLFTQETEHCNGQDPTIIAALQCSVPLTALAASPFSLPLGDSIVVIVVATNAKGDSPTSSEGTGATMISEPQAPVNLQED